jgi:hypothetical protein
MAFRWIYWTFLSPVVTIYTTSLNIQQFSVLPTQCIYVFCVDLKTNSNYFPIQLYLNGLYNLDGMCLLRDTDWSLYIIQLNSVSTHTLALCTIPQYMERLLLHKYVTSTLFRLVQILCTIFWVHLRFYVIVQFFEMHHSATTLRCITVLPYSSPQVDTCAASLLLSKLVGLYHKVIFVGGPWKSTIDYNWLTY